MQDGGQPAEEDTGFIQGILDYANSFLEKEEEETSILQEGPPPIVNPRYLDLGTFVVNLKEGKYFLKATITLVFEELAPYNWLNQRMPIVKDLIITHLGRLTAKELRNQKVRQLLRNDLRNKLNSLFPNAPSWDDKRPVKKILFQEFYTQ